MLPAHSSLRPREHVAIEPSILYMGTPVALISTCNEDGSSNLAPISSIFWLGWRAMVGIASSSQTAINLSRTGECVINLPSVEEVDAVDRIARLTACNPMPDFRVAMGYEYEPDKFGRAGVTAAPSLTVSPQRVNECPVQMEAVLCATHGLGQDTPSLQGFITVFELRITQVYADPALMMEGHQHRIDPDKWSPLLMSFQKFYGLNPQQVKPSRLAEIPEQAYHSPDIDRARTEAEALQTQRKAG